MRDEDRVESIFQDAADLPSSERSGYLDQACGEDADLRSEVETLLASLDKPSGLLERPLIETCLDEVAEIEPGRIDGYEILREIGRGGSGRVFEARQASPRRRVALKILKGTALGPRVQQRFQQEIEILGLLEHPGICRIYDAGKSELFSRDGDFLGERLFFAMELVEGQPITTYARQHALGLRARIELLLGVAEAVAQAHESGVLHRDLKPANILVAEEVTASPETTTGNPRNRTRTKVLDFGIGRLLDENSLDQSRLTLEGAVFGTPAYMSPEQFLGERGRVDTRSDVWALGVLGYELLAGSHPFMVEGASPLRIQALITGQDPKPLRRCVKGLDRDAETLIEKAMEKDPERRYPTARGFAEDLRRLLRSEPILARPPSVLYQLHKWADRHRAMAAGLGIGLLGLVIGLVLSLRFAFEARADRDRALLAEKDSRDINDFFNSEVIRVADPARSQGKVPDVHELIQEMSGALDGRFADRPLVEARIRAALGDTWLGMGKLPQAGEQFGAARLLFDKALAGGSEEALALEVKYGEWLSLSGRAQEALEQDHATLDRLLAALGKSHELTLSQLGNLALHLQNLGRFEEALGRLREVIRLREEILGKEDPETLVAWNNYALFLSRRGRYEESEKIDRRVLRLRTKILGKKHPRRLTSLSNLSLDLQRQGRSAEALPLAQEALHLRATVLGEGHPEWLKSCNIVSLILSALGRTAEARKIVEEALEQAKTKQGLEHPDTVRLMHSLAKLCRESGELEDADRYARKSLELARGIYPADHWILAVHERSLARILAERGQKKEALTLLEDALRIFEKSLGPDHDRSRKAREDLRKLKGE